MDLCVQLAGIRGGIRQQYVAKISHNYNIIVTHILKVIAYDSCS